MTEQYKDMIDQIHAPEALILKTQVKIRQRRRMHILWRSVSVAAVLMLFLGGTFWYGRNVYTSINIQRLVFDNEIKAGVNAGIKDQEEDNTNEDYLAVGDDLNRAQQIMEQIAPSTIKGQKVYIGYDEKTKMLYAGYQKGDKTYLIEDSEKTEEEFISFLKEIM